MKVKTQYSCQNCGQSSSKWLGRCPGCESWNSMVEERVNEEFRSTRESVLEMAGLNEGSGPRGSRSGGRSGGRAGSSGPGLGGSDWVSLDPEAGESSEAGSSGQGQAAPQKRLSTGMVELDRVLGGGLIPDSFVLLGGDPGIGKSTLLLQMARGLRERQQDLRILYVSGEESVDQIRGRAHRLGVSGGGQVFLAAETQLERVLANVKELKPHILIMDSLQTFATGVLESAPGSVSQVREVAARLMMLAKSAGLSVWLVGHVTKEGSIAGPKVVEHMVDTVLYFESEGGQSYRLLRAVKNRFGSSREMGVFEMDGEGLREVSNPSSLFLSERQEPVSGTAIAAALEGSRPILVELQALVTPTGLAMPRRTSVGMDGARVSLIAAILEKHMKLRLGEQDLFFNVAGGLKLTEPACDLAAAAAIWSSLEERALPSGWIFIGEVGLTGEVRRVTQIETRIDEAKKLGYRTMVVPQGALERLSKSASEGVKLLPISRIAELPKLLGTGGGN